MDDIQFNVIDYISDEWLEKMGFTRETFKGSRTELLLNIMLGTTEEMIQEETKSLMKEQSLSYGEARIIVTEKVLNDIKKGMVKGSERQ